MPTLLGAAVLAIGGILILRVARREWKRVNQDLQAQRSAPRQAEDVQKLERDPVTGSYHPKDD